MSSSFCIFSSNFNKFGFYKSNRLPFQFLFSQLGINYLDMDLLLGYSENENIPGRSESIINEFGRLTVSNTKSLLLQEPGSCPNI